MQLMCRGEHFRAWMISRGCNERKAGALPGLQLTGKQQDERVA
jgi:hypothetical protein